MKRSIGLTACLLLSTIHGKKDVQGKIKTQDPKTVRQHLYTPDSVFTEQLGTLLFNDGFPDKQTTEKLYDHLDFLHGIETFLNGIPAASLYAIREGLRSQGVDRNGKIIIFENLMDSNSLFLTANSGSIYTTTWLDLKDGPIVVESPPNTLGFVNDFFFRYVADLGNRGPDEGKGGKFLFLPPDYTGTVPKGYFTYQSPTYNNWLLWRGFTQKGDPKPGVESIKKHTKIYPLAQKNNPPKTVFINVSGNSFNTIHSNDFNFYHELNGVIQEEPSEAFEPQILGIFESIGIIKGKPFNPDRRMKRILEDAVKVGNATARAISFRPRDEKAYIYKDSKTWFNPFTQGYQFLTQSGARNIGARVMFHYPYTGISPAMEQKMIGLGSKYAVAAIDKNGNYFDGSKTYSITIPANVPAKKFWSFVVYDPQTRSMLKVPDRKFPAVNSSKDDIKANTDGSYTIWFSPQKPKGIAKGNWLKTVPNKGWFTIFRLYGPLEPWFDKTWKLGEFQVKN